MTDEHAHLTHHRTVFDGWKSISIALYMSLVGYGVLVGVPVISTAWVNLLGFTEVAGRTRCRRGPWWTWPLVPY